MDNALAASAADGAVDIMPFPSSDESSASVQQAKQISRDMYGFKRQEDYIDCEKKFSISQLKKTTARDLAWVSYLKSIG